MDVLEDRDRPCSACVALYVSAFDGRSASLDFGHHATSGGHFFPYTLGTAQRDNCKAHWIYGNLNLDCCFAVLRPRLLTSRVHSRTA